LKHFPKRCKLTPIQETKIPCNWKGKWVPDGTYPKSPISTIFDKKSIGNKVVFSETLPRTGSERCTRFFPVPLQNCSERLRTSLDVFGKRRICLCRHRKSWYSPVKNLTPLTQKKLAGITLLCLQLTLSISHVNKLFFSFLFTAIWYSGRLWNNLQWTRVKGIDLIYTGSLCNFVYETVA